jgi:ribosomal protein S12 methylthiotransferase accessory factor
MINQSRDSVQKVFFAGTHRVRAPEETYDAIVPLLRDYGITRLADVTDLDTLGIPVVMSVRPMAATLSVSQGKGATKLLASVSAAMEAIELWHAENAVPSPVLCSASAGSLRLPYNVIDLEWPQGNLITESTRLDWIGASTLRGDEPTFVPLASVYLGPSADFWEVPGLTTSSNGLASGNTVAEATVHALYEILERDAMVDLVCLPDADRTHIDPATVDDLHCAELIHRIVESETRLEIEQVPSRANVMCISTRLWREDLATTIVCGAGAHSDLAVALSRAITEAAQSRLTQIVGTRDDIPSAAYRAEYLRSPPPSPGKAIAWTEAKSRQIDSYVDTDVAEVDLLADKIHDLTGKEPIRVVLEDRPEFSVVKIICPGMRRPDRHRAPGSGVSGQGKGVQV